MTTRNKIIYWIATIWLGLGMLLLLPVILLLLLFMKNPDHEIFSVNQ